MCSQTYLWLLFLIISGVDGNTQDRDFVQKLLLTLRHPQHGDELLNISNAIIAAQENVDATLKPTQVQHGPQSNEVVKQRTSTTNGTFFVEKRVNTLRSHTDASTEWFQHTGRDFHGFKDELSFPGSDFLLVMIDSHLINGLYMENTIKDPFQVDESRIAAIGADLEKVTSIHTDPEELAMIYTRRVTSYIQHERMKCAAAKFDMMSMKAMLMEINALFADDDDSMNDFLLTLLQDLPQVPGIPWNTLVVANELCIRIHDRIFNDTVHYLLGRSYLDVTMFSHGLFKTFKTFFRSSYVYQEAFVAIITDILKYDANVHCPTDQELKMQRRDAMWDLTTKLEELETTELCMGMRSFIEANFFASGFAPNIMASSDGYDRTMQHMCNYVKTYVGHFYTNIKEYESMLLQRDPEGLKCLFQKHLTTDGLMTLASVLETLRWKPNFPVVDNIESTQINLTLPAEQVIKNAKNDISFWQSFLNTLTEDTFTQMDLSDFKKSIRHWLDEKQKILDAFNAKNQF